MMVLISSGSLKNTAYFVFVGALGNALTHYADVWLRHNVLGRLAWSGADFLWMAPLSYVVMFAVAAGLPLTVLALAVLSGIFVGLPNAQVDLLLVGHCRGKRLEKAVNALEKIVGQEINFSLMTEDDYRARLYSFDWFLKEITDHDAVILIDNVNKRKHSVKARPHKRIVKVHKRIRR